MSNYISGALKLLSAKVRRASAHLRVFRFPGISKADDIGAFTRIKLSETRHFLKSRGRDGRVGGEEMRAAVASFLLPALVSHQFLQGIFSQSVCYVLAPHSGVQAMIPAMFRANTLVTVPCLNKYQRAYLGEISISEKYSKKSLTVCKEKAPTFLKAK